MRHDFAIDETSSYAGRLRFFVDFWKSITFDKWIIKSVAGLEIPLTNIVQQINIPYQISYNEAQNTAISAEIIKMVNKGIIKHVNDTIHNEFISTIFPRPKKSGGLRIILNLKQFNHNVDKQHFKMQTLQAAIDLMKKDSYMASIDYKDAYYTVPIDSKYKRYLRFFWDGNKYEFQVLPNGLTTGPRHFTKIVRVILRYLQKRGFSITNYIDDNFLIEDTFNRCLESVYTTIKVSSDAGFIVSFDKSVLEPSQILTYLGFVLNTIEMTIKLTREKVEKIKALILKALSVSSMTIHDLAQLVGKLVATFPGVAYARLYYRQLDIEKTQALKHSKGNYKEHVSLSRLAIQDLQWWLDNLDTAFVDANPKIPDIIITCDASNLGWGGWMGTKSTQGQWSERERQIHINEKELLAVLFSLKSLLISQENQTILIKSDNTVTVSYIANMGGKISSCHKIAKAIWEWAIERNLWLMAAHIPGKENVHADTLSRSLTVNTEWELSMETFIKVKEHYPDLNFDLFASRLNFKLSRYASWLPDPTAETVDAFTMNWNTIFGYAFPPFSLIGKVLKKVEQDNCKIVIVVPDWPTSFWYAKLFNMAIDTPFYLQKTPHPMTNPIDTTANIRAGVIVCCVAASTYHRSYQTPSQGSSWRHGGLQLNNNIDHFLRDGTIFVKKGKKILFKRL